MYLKLHGKNCLFIEDFRSFHTWKYKTKYKYVYHILETKKIIKIGSKRGPILLSWLCMISLVSVSVQKWLGTVPLVSKARELWSRASNFSCHLKIKKKNKKKLKTKTVIGIWNSSLHGKKSCLLSQSTVVVSLFSILWLKYTQWSNIILIVQI